VNVLGGVYPPGHQRADDEAATMPNKTIQIYVDGKGQRRRGVGACKGCGQRVFWCETLMHNAIPFDVVPEVIAVSGDLETVSTERVHWSNCPKREDFHRKPEPTPRETPPGPSPGLFDL
jgi:hypothetical protein